MYNMFICIIPLYANHVKVRPHAPAMRPVCNVCVPRCVCPSTRYGADCEYEYRFCADNPCDNGATCSETDDGYTCTCAPSFTGGDCEVSRHLAMHGNHLISLTIMVSIIYFGCLITLAAMISQVFPFIIMD